MTPLEGAGLAIGAFALVAPNYWPTMPKNFNRFLVVGGVLLFAYSGLEAIQEWFEMTISIGPKALYFLGAILIAIAALWQLETKPNSSAEETVSAPELIPAIPTDLPIGTLKIENPTIDLSKKVSTGEWAAEMFFDIRNNSDEILDFQAELEGNVNGVLPPKDKVTKFSGIFDAKDVKHIIYARIAPLNIVAASKITEASAVGTLSYKIRYKRHTDKDFKRLTGKTMTFTVWGIPENLVVGSKFEFKTRVLYTNETEE